MKLSMGTMKLAYGLGVLLVATMGAQAAMADTTYTYTGKDFTSAGSPFSTSDFVSGSFTISAPLADDLSLDDIAGDLVSYSFSDGVDTLTQTNSSTAVFDVSTDTNGLITQWHITLLNAPLDTKEIYTISIPTFTKDDGSAIGIGQGSNTNDPGSWATTPEPCSLGLFGTGALWIVGLIRRKIAG